MAVYLRRAAESWPLRAPFLEVWADCVAEGRDPIFRYPARGDDWKDFTCDSGGDAAGVVERVRKWLAGLLDWLMQAEDGNS